MTDVPGLTPDTTPLTEPIVATPALALIHVPPVIASLNVVVDPMQTPNPPEIAVGVAITVTSLMATHAPPAGIV